MMYSRDELDNLAREAAEDAYDDLDPVRWPYDEPYGGDQRAENDDYEANAPYDYLREAYGPSAVGLDDGDDFDYGMPRLTGPAYTDWECRLSGFDVPYEIPF